MPPYKKGVNFILYNLVYEPNQYDENAPPVPKWYRENKFFVMANNNDIISENLENTEILKFTSDDIDSIYPNDITSYNYFDEIIERGPDDDNGNPQFIKIEISNTTINLLLREKSILTKNEKIFWFCDNYVIPNDYYHNRGRFE